MEGAKGMLGCIHRYLLGCLRACVLACFASCSLACLFVSLFGLRISAPSLYACIKVSFYVVQGVVWDFRKAWIEMECARFGVGVSGQKSCLLKQGHSNLSPKHP